MNLLTPPFWDDIMEANKGERFESLIEDLLKEMHPDINWNRTQKTHDGKKDFIVTIPIANIGDFETYWVECKNYENAISINTLSPTLVMAVIRNANGILFFSYSKLNDNAEEYLTQFAEKVNKCIMVYDNERLESEILKYPKILKKYFTGFKKIFSFQDQYPEFSCRVKFNRDVAYNYGNEELKSYEHKGEKSLHVNETFCIDIFIRNLSSLEQNIELKLKPDEFQYNFSLLNKKLIKDSFSEAVKINPAGIYFKRIVFRFERYAAKILLPKVYIYNKGILLKELSPGEAKGNWIINAPLIGSRYLKIIDDIRNITSHRNSSLAYCLYGESGTGKSRLFKEAKDVLIENGYQIHSEDGDFQNQRSTGLQLIKRVISILSGLPLRNYITKEQDSFDIVKDEWSNNRIAKLLYSEDISLTDPGIQDEIVEIFFDLTATKPVAILIDNVQFFDEDLAILLHFMLNESIGKNTPFLFVLSFNTDFLFPQTKAFQLLERIKRLSKEKSEQFFHSKIKGFEKHQAEQFVEHCIPGAMETYSETFKHIIQKTGNFPLYIEQMLLLLNDEGVIKKREDFFYILDITNLHRLINDLPETLGDLIKMRWSFILKSKLGSVYEALLRFVTLFQKLPCRLINELGFEDDSLNTLISLGVLELTPSEQIIFHHSQFLIFFNARYFLHGIDKRTASASINLIEKYDLMQLYPAQYFIARNTIQPSDPEVLKFGATCLLDERISTEYKARFALYLYNSLRLTQRAEGIPIIRLYTRICDDIKTYEEFSHALMLFEEIYQDKFMNYKNYLDDGEDYFYFILRYANSYLSVHKDNNAHEILLAALKVIDHFSFVNETNKKKAKAELLNRLCVTYKSLNEPIQATAAAEESLLLSTEIGDKKVTIKNYIDKGYIYYKDINKTKELFECWDKAWEIFNAEYDKSLERKRVSAFYHKSLLELIRNNRVGALKYANEALKCAEQQLDVFNRIKILLTITIIYSLDGTEKLSKIENMAKEAIDLCASNNSMRSYWTSWHLLGKITHDLDTKQNAYLTSFESLKSFAVNAKMEKLYLYFFEDLAITMRWIGKNNTKDLQQLLISVMDKEIREKMTEILKMNDEDFRHYMNTFQPRTPITDGKTSFPCP